MGRVITVKAGKPLIFSIVVDSVVDRIEKMRPWHLFRIYMASTGSPSITDEFKMVLAKKLVNRLSFLPAEVS